MKSIIKKKETEKRINIFKKTYPDIIAFLVGKKDYFFKRLDRNDVKTLEANYYLDQPPRLGMFQVLRDIGEYYQALGLRYELKDDDKMNILKGSDMYYQLKLRFYYHDNRMSDLSIHYEFMKSI